MAVKASRILNEFKASVYWQGPDLREQWGLPSAPTLTAARNLILDESIAIGTELLGTMRSAQVGSFWITRKYESRGRVSSQASFGLYEGVAGIVMFLLALHKVTGREELLAACHEACSWLWHESRSTNDRSFLTGTMGIASTFAKVFELTGEQVHLDRALFLCKNIDGAIPALESDDLMTGLAGLALGFVQVHCVSGEDNLVTSANRCIDRLLSRAFHGPKGLFWGRTVERVRGLCGLAHGASGIGFVLLELAEYLPAPELRWVALQAFRYETSWYSHAENNWRDLRCEVGDFDRKSRDYLDGRVDKLLPRLKMNAWCNGAGGIALVRARAYEIMGCPHFLEDFLRAEPNLVLPSEGQSCCLCHGRGGNAEALLEGARAFGESRYLAQAIGVALECIRDKELRGRYLSGIPGDEQYEDESLFLGKAGIGYFFLRTLDSSLPSVLLPRVTTLSDNPTPPASVTRRIPNLVEVKLRAIKRVYPRTLSVLEYYSPSTARSFLSEHEDEPVEELILSFHKQVRAIRHSLLDRSLAEYLGEILGLEERIFEIDQRITSYNLVAIKAEVARRDSSALLKLSTSEFFGTVLHSDPDLCITMTSWDWSRLFQLTLRHHFGQAKQANFLAILPGVLRTEEKSLSEVSHAILQVFEAGFSVMEGIVRLKESVRDCSERSESDLDMFLTEQIREMVAGCLILRKTLPSVLAPKQVHQC